MSFGKLFKRHDSPTRGRHLIATQNIQEGQTVFVERPILSLQSLGNGHQGALVCRHCRAFIGGPDTCLAVACGRISRENVLEEFKQKQNSGGEKDESYEMVPCRNKCGELYCSQECEEKMWSYGGHELMCTGLIPDLESNNGPEENSDDVGKYEGKSDEDNGKMNNEPYLHPLLEFKVHAVQSNEIFLMVGDLVAKVISQRRQQILSQKLYEGQESNCNGTLEDIIAPYLDFTLKPWWEVATEPLMSDSMRHTEAVHLQKILKELCSTSSSLLKEAITKLLNGLKASEQDDEKLFYSTLKQSIDECVEKYDIFSELFFGKIIGSFEQNALGIRARHPLCREIIENHSFRKRGHTDILRCLESAGMIEQPEEEDHDVGNERNIMLDEENNVKEAENEGGWEDYDCDEIAGFIAGLQIDEEGNKKSQNPEDSNHDDRAENKKCSHDECSNEECSQEDEDGSHEDEGGGDALDALFTPLDGTAMYSTTCKMNHSCKPNMMAKYSYSCSGGGKRTRWGKHFPLVVSCNALQDIEKGEELCISYINTDLSYEERSKALENYGFKCNCKKCLREMESDSKNVETTLSTCRDETFEDEDDLFGSEDEDEDKEGDPFGSEDEDEDDLECSKVKIDNDNDGDSTFGMILLTQLEEDLNKSFSISSQNSIPMNIIAPAISFSLQLGSQSLRDLDLNVQEGDFNENRNKMLRECLRGVLDSLNNRDFVKALQTAIIGEEVAMNILNLNQGWPYLAHREAHRCFSIIAAIVYAKTGNFLPAMTMLDKAIIFGLSRQKIRLFLEFVEYHHSACMITHFSDVSMNLVPEYRQSEFRDLIARQGLSAPIHHPVAELNLEGCIEKFQHYFSHNEPVVIRGYADSWPALQKWR